MGRLKSEEVYKRFDEGLLMCKSCNKYRTLNSFYRQIKYDGEIYYKIHKCKGCVNKKGFRDSGAGYKQLNLKDNIVLTKEVKTFLETIIRCAGYIDSTQSFILVHHHINTFGSTDRIFPSIQYELEVMYKELLLLYKKQ
jgi:hypothetical protein